MKCDICNKSINGYYVRDFWGNHFCSKHLDEFNACFSCNRLICQSITNGGRTYSDGRCICNICYQSAVLDYKQATQILYCVKKEIAQLGFDIGNKKVDIVLADFQYVKNYSGSFGKVLGRTHIQSLTQNGKTIQTNAKQISLLYGMPKIYFGAIIAHELCHVWLVRQEYPPLSTIVTEGICELCTYLWLQKQNTLDAQYRITLMEKNPDPVYGQGFRLARNRMQDSTLDMLLDFIKLNSRFPQQGELLKIPILTEFFAPSRIKQKNKSSKTNSLSNTFTNFF